MELEGKRIVYIEDDHRNRKLVELILNAEGATVWCERWGIPGMALASVIDHLPLDMILLDLMFPNGFSGYDVFAELHKLPLLENVPIVMISAADAAIEIPKAQQMGLTSYIPKPIDSDEFARQLKAIMEGRALWQESSVA